MFAKAQYAIIALLLLVPLSSYAMPKYSSAVASLPPSHSAFIPENLGEGKKRGPYVKHTLPDLQSVVLGHYTAPKGTRILTYANKNDIPRRTLAHYWKESGLQVMKQQGRSYLEAQKAVKQYFEHKAGIKKKAMDDLHNGNKYMDQDEENFVINCCTLLSAMGCGLTREDACDLIDRIIQPKKHIPGNMRVSSKSVLDGIMKKPGMKEKIHFAKTSSLDPARAKQAKDETRVAMFCKLDDFCKLVHSLLPPQNRPAGPNYCDWAAEFQYNGDEVGIDLTKRRKKVLATRNGLRKFCLTPEGDGKMAFHVTGLIFSCGNGQCAHPARGIEGAPPPFIVHQDNSVKISMEERKHQRREGPDPKVCVGDRHVEGLVDLEVLRQHGMDKEKACLQNPLGFSVRTTSTGSMTQESFYDAAHHFLRHLPKGHGCYKVGRDDPNWKPVILFLDGHASRWNAHALRLLIANGVCPFFLPSHTSIWTQPNDCGINVTLHRIIEQEAVDERRFCSKTSVHKFNAMFARAWLRFLDSERKDLLNKGKNNTTNSWKHTGLGHLDTHPKGWEYAIATLGLVDPAMESALIKAHADAETDDNALKPDKRQREVRLKDERPEFDEYETQTLRRTYHDPNSNDHPLIMARMHANKIIARWRLKRSTMSETQRSACLFPTAGNTLADRITLKHYEFYSPNLDDMPRPVPLTPEQKALEMAKQRLEATAAAESLSLEMLVTKENGDGEQQGTISIPGSATKTRGGQWYVFRSDAGSDDLPVIATTKDLLDASTYRILAPNDACSESERKRLQQKEARDNKYEKELVKKRAKTKAKEERRSWLKQQYKDIVEMTQQDSSLFTLEYFLNLSKAIEGPFQTTIDGVKVVVKGNDVAAVTVLSYDCVGDLLLSTKREEQKRKSKRPRRGKKGNRSPNTERAEDGINATCHVEKYDKRDEAEDLEKERKRLERNIESRTKALTEFREWMQPQKESYDAFCQAERNAGRYGPYARIPYWLVHENLTAIVVKKFVRVFAPDKGVTSKKKPDQLAELQKLPWSKYFIESILFMFDDETESLKEYLQQLNDDQGNQDESSDIDADELEEMESSGM